MCHCRLLLWCRFKARKGVNGLAGPGALARRDWLSGATRERRCSYAQCPQTSANTRWHLVTPYTNAGGRDWSEMVGQTLCSCCFQQFRLKAPHTHTHTHTHLQCGQELSLQAHFSHSRIASVALLACQSCGVM